MALKIQTDTYSKRSLPADQRRRRRKLLLLPLLLLFLLEGVVLLGGALLSFSSGYSWLFATMLGHVILVGSSAARTLPELPGSLFLITSGEGTLVFNGMFAIVFVLYLLAVRYLPGRISHRYVLLSTLLLGGAYLFIPIVTSQDIFSYIAYARIGVIYHLNPLTTLPTSIASDPVYPLLYWMRQPSAYGPAWAIITCVLQWIALLFGLRNLFSMEMLLRMLGLSMHLGSTQLIWSISGRFGGTFAGMRRRRALLAFAWNPLLLLEACVNAHCDTVILFFVLFALWWLLPRALRQRFDTGERNQSGTYLWLLLPRAEEEREGYLLATLILAVATCIKITLVLLLPGLLLFLWMRHISDAHIGGRIRVVALAAGVYIGIVVLMYAPFWQDGAILQLLHVSPAVTHDVNSPYQFVVCLIASLKGMVIPGMQQPGSRIEAISHEVSIVLFALAYFALCLRSLLIPRSVNTVPVLIRWMAIAWFLYCIVGSPWFWSWYTIPLFGLLTLIEADSRINGSKASILRPFPVGWFARLLTISMFTLYSFSNWQPGNTSLSYLPQAQLFYSNGYFPLLPHFRWDYFAGIWIWILPFGAVGIWFLLTRLHRSVPRTQVATGTNPSCK